MNLSCSILGGNKGRPKGDFGRNMKFLVGTPRLSLAVWAAWNSTGPVRGPTIGGSPTPRFLLYGAVGCSRYGNMGEDVTDTEAKVDHMVNLTRSSVHRTGKLEYCWNAETAIYLTSLRTNGESDDWNLCCPDWLLEVTLSCSNILAHWLNYQILGLSFFTPLLLIAACACSHREWRDLFGNDSCVGGVTLKAHEYPKRRHFRKDNSKTISLLGGQRQF